MDTLPAWLQLLLPKAQEIFVHQWYSVDGKRKIEPGVTVVFKGEQVGLPPVQWDLEAILYIYPDELTYLIKLCDKDLDELATTQQKQKLGSFAEFTATLFQLSRSLL